MMVKDTAGNEFDAATNGKANAGLTLGIIGTALGGLLAAGGLGNNGGNSGGSLLGGLLGGSNGGGKSGNGVTDTINISGGSPTVVPVPVPMPVTEHQYYEDSMRNIKECYGNEVQNLKGYYNNEIQNQKDFFVYAQGVSQRLCDLEQRVSVDETSIAKNFEFMASQNEWQNRFFDEKMRYADLLEQCRIDKATCKCIKGEVYASPSNLADPYVGRQMVLGSYAAPLCDNGCGYTTYNNGCGCGF